MQPSDLAALIVDAIGAATAPLLARIKALEAVGPVHGRDGRDGVAGLPGLPGEKGEPGPAGRDADAATILELKSEIADLRIEAASLRVLATKSEAPDLEAVKALIASELRAIPMPKDGAPGRDGLDGKHGIDGKDGAPGRDGLDGKHGIDGKDGAPGRDGVDGKDGQPGRDGRDGAPGLQGEKGLDGKDGAPGRDGLNGTLENLKIAHDGERTFKFLYKDTDELLEGGIVTIPATLDRGVYVAGKAYGKGDAVSWNGSIWIAQADTMERPWEKSETWRLAVKHGQKGSQGPKGDPGAPGRNGRDLTAMDGQGGKW